MIISKTPLRISFCGGGSDIPSFYSKHGGCVLSTTINKYIYISSVHSFNPQITQLKYSMVESVTDIDEIKHPVFREMLRRYGLSGFEMSSISDIPAGTGLGSSSTFTVGLSNILHAHMGETMSKEALAKEACEMEIDVLEEPIGKQDQYAAAYGGLNFIEFNRDGTVQVERIKVDTESKRILDDRLMMVYLGGVRSASEILRKQSSNTKSGKAEDNQKRMCDLARELRHSLESGDMDSMGECLDKGWKLKRTLSEGITNPQIDEMYERITDLGATGGKLLGAGGNGFMLFYARENAREEILRKTKDLRWMPFRFESSGSQIIYNNEE